MGDLYPRFTPGPKRSVWGRFWAWFVGWREGRRERALLESVQRHTVQHNVHVHHSHGRLEVHHTHDHHHTHASQTVYHFHEQLPVPESPDPSPAESPMVSTVEKDLETGPSQ